MIGVRNHKLPAPRAVAAMIDAGSSAAELARVYGVTQRTIRRSLQAAACAGARQTPDTAIPRIALGRRASVHMDNLPLAPVTLPAPAFYLAQLKETGRL